MTSSDMRSPYASSAYDDDLCLKPPAILWIATLYLSRALLLPVTVGLAHVAGISDDVLALLRGLWSEEVLLPSLIAMPVLVCFFRRVPTASAMTRWIWARGRTFLALSASVDLAVRFISQYRVANVDDTLAISLVTASVDGYFLLYILTARRVRDTFASFPDALVAPAK